MITFIIFIVIMIVGYGWVVKLILELDRKAHPEVKPTLTQDPPTYSETVTKVQEFAQKEKDEMPKIKLSVNDVVKDVLKLETKKGKGKEINVADGMEFMRCLRAVLKKKKGVDLYQIIHA